MVVIPISKYLRFGFLLKVISNFNFLYHFLKLALYYSKNDV